jgi:hypothetical protein
MELEPSSAHPEVNLLEQERVSFTERQGGANRTVST